MEQRHSYGGDSTAAALLPRRCVGADGGSWGAVTLLQTIKILKKTPRRKRHSCRGDSAAVAPLPSRRCIDADRGRWGAAMLLQTIKIKKNITCS
jgi:hypothetical protein